MDEFERNLARRLGGGAELEKGAARIESLISDLRRRRGIGRWLVWFVALGTAGAILISGHMLAAQVLPAPDSLLAALLWFPAAMAALFVVLVWCELLRAMR